MKRLKFEFDEFQLIDKIDVWTDHATEWMFFFPAIKRNQLKSSALKIGTKTFEKTEHITLTSILYGGLEKVLTYFKIKVSKYAIWILRI